MSFLTRLSVIDLPGASPRYRLARWPPSWPQSIGVPRRSRWAHVPPNLDVLEEPGKDSASARRADKMGRRSSLGVRSIAEARVSACVRFYDTPVLLHTALMTEFVSE